MSFMAEKHGRCECETHHEGYINNKKCILYLIYTNRLVTRQKVRSVAKIPFGRNFEKWAQTNVGPDRKECSLRFVLFRIG